MPSDVVRRATWRSMLRHSPPICGHNGGDHIAESVQGEMGTCAGVAFRCLCQRGEIEQRAALIHAGSVVFTLPALLYYYVLLNVRSSQVIKCPGGEGMRDHKAGRAGPHGSGAARTTSSLNTIHQAKRRGEKELSPRRCAVSNL